MAQQIFTRKEQLDRDVISYRGDDPLHLRYDFLLWLDTNFGKDKVLDIFSSVLQETINIHCKDVKYKDDDRFIELQMIYAGLQPDPLSVYQSYYDVGIAHNCSLLYINWAGHLAANGDFAAADKIYKIGCDKVAPTRRSEVLKAFEKFLAVIGRKYLDGELIPPREPCPKCSPQIPNYQPIANEHMEMNPGKAGFWDDFCTNVAFFEPHDPKLVRQYPRDKVYPDNGKEYSLEEIKAAEYFEKLKNGTKRHENKIEPMRMVCEPFETNQEDVQKAGLFPTPLLACSGKEESVSAHSFTSRTKMALNLVQDMWSSPAPETPGAIPPKADYQRENTEHKPPIPIYHDANPETPKAAEKKPLAAFSIYCSPENASNLADQGKQFGTGKKSGLQSKPNILSERKINTREVAEEPQLVTKQQLQFEGDPGNGVLANKLSEASISEGQFQPFGGIKPLFPVEQGKDDFSDVTCNTKAFNFALPSSTPVQQRKSLAPYVITAQQNSEPYVAEERPSCLIQQNLSVILEASKERCSSSASSTGYSQPRTPACPSKPLILEDYGEIDPFCPVLNDKLLAQLNFPQPQVHDGWHLSNSVLPAITKQLRLGNETFSILGELGKGAYARVVKASLDNCTVALKIEKPACKWEYYIAKELQRRSDPKARSAFVNIKNAYIFSNGSILMTEFAKLGNLLNIINQVKQETGKVFELVISLHFCIEMMRIIEYLHKCKIIHGDIKPDNFVLRSTPTINAVEPCLMLIDFGRSIDMSLFPEGTKFLRVVTTEGFQCNEMKENRPWNYQTDLYGLAGCMYCVLTGEYMKVVKKGDEWKLFKALPRNVKRDLWDPILGQLLNVPSCEQLPNLTALRTTLEKAFDDTNYYLKHQNFNHFANLFTGK